MQHKSSNYCSKKVFSSSIKLLISPIHTAHDLWLFNIAKLTFISNSTKPNLRHYENRPRCHSEADCVSLVDIIYYAKIHPVMGKNATHLSQ